MPCMYDGMIRCILISDNVYAINSVYQNMPNAIYLQQPNLGCVDLEIDAYIQLGSDVWTSTDVVNYLV